MTNTMTTTTEMTNTMRTMLTSTAGKMTLGIMVAVSLALAVLLLVAKWKLFTKMGEKGWKSLIPIYSEYLMFKNVWSGKAFAAFVGVQVAGGILSSAAQHMNGAPVLALSLCSLALCIAALVMMVKFVMKLSRCFGHGTGYGIGLLFAQPLFTMILGLGKSEYARA